MKRIHKPLVVLSAISLLCSCSGNTSFPMYPEETKTFLNSEDYSLPGGNYFSGTKNPDASLGNDEDVYVNEQTKVIFRKKNNIWYQTDYTVKKDFISSNGHHFYTLSNGLTYDAGLVSSPAIEDDDDFDGIINSKDNDNQNHVLAGSFIQRAETYAYSFSVDMDYRRFFDDDNTKYSYDFANLGVVLATSTYPKVQIQQGDNVILARNNIMSLFGCDDLLDIRLQAKDFTIDSKDTLSCIMAHYRFLYEGKPREVVMVSFEGTADGDQWYSDFDFGVDDAVYDEITGSDHPEWKNRKNHKGFDVTLNRFLPIFEEYVKENLLSDAEKAIYITGHSRGAALANLLGQVMDENQDFRSFTYTFASPNATTQKSVSPSVFNLINEGDLITYIPMKESVGFERNGTDMIYSYQDNYQNEFQKEFPDTSYISSNGKALASALASIASDAEEFYTIKEDEEHRLYPVTYGDEYDTKEAAQKDLDMKLSDLSICGPSTMFKTKLIENENGTFSNEIYSCPAALTYYFAGCLGLESEFAMVMYLINMFAAMPSGWIAPLDEVALWINGFLLNHQIGIYHCIVETTK